MTENMTRTIFYDDKPIESTNLLSLYFVWSHLIELIELGFAKTEKGKTEFTF